MVVRQEKDVTVKVHAKQKDEKDLENLGFNYISTSSTWYCATRAFSTIYLPTLLSSVTEGLGIPGPHHIDTFFGSQRLCPLGSLFRTHYALV